MTTCAPYDTATGQLVLMVITAMFAGALAGMERLGRIELPDRFIGRRRPTRGRA